MALPPQFDEPAFEGLQRIDHALDVGQAHVFRVLWFWLPPGSVARNPQFQALLASRFLTDVAINALIFGALISTARGDGGAINAALLGTAFLLPSLLLGLYGGAVADALPKRVALAGAYVGMGVLTLAVAFVFGSDFRSLLVVIFVVRILHQFSQPSEASTLPLVATAEELAAANSMLGLISSAADLLGKAVLAPLIVRAYGVDPVTIIAGMLFLFSASRVFDLRPPPHPGPVGEGEGTTPASTMGVVRWLLAERQVMWMLVLAALASTINVVLAMLGPQYVSEVLDVDPANTLYVFAPAPIGLLAALGLAPLLIRWAGERPIAILGFVLVSSAVTALGLVATLTDLFGWLLFFGIPGVGPRVEMAALLSMFLGAGVTLAVVSTQTYISRAVPLRIQGRAFALLGLLKDGFAIPPLLLMGALASTVGVATVITVSPIFLLVLAVTIDRSVTRFGRSRSPLGGPRYG